MPARGEEAAQSPSLLRNQSQGPHLETSPSLSPSILGAAELPNQESAEGFLLTPASAPAAAGVREGASAPRPSRAAGRGGRGRSATRIPVQPPVPEAPPARPSPLGGASFLSREASVAPDESYGADERALNDFIALHPMCSMEATSHKTMQLVGTMFEKASVQVADVPVVKKSYDDGYLRYERTQILPTLAARNAHHYCSLLVRSPPNIQIGERPCACDAHCMCTLMAKHRHGAESSLGFIGTEFLLPTERETFLAGKGLPPRRKKCLVCTRYFQNFLYIQARICNSNLPRKRVNTTATLAQARTDPNFRVTGAPIGMQAFGNTVAEPPDDGPDDEPDLAELGRSMSDLPVNASPVSSLDGYKAEAMLFVDEEFAGSSRAAREGRASTLAWKPVVAFKTRHYRYVRGTEGPHLVQVGIGADDATGTGLLFAQPAVGTVVPLSA